MSQMKRRALAATVAAVLTSAALAQTTSAAKSSTKATVKPAAKAASAAPDPTPAVVAASAPAPAPKGPSGIGDVKLGMTRDALLALPETSLVRLAGSLVEKTPGPKDTPLKPGESRYEGALLVPGQPQPLKTRFSFVDDKLQSTSIDFDSESLFESMAKQIADKYGPGVVDDGMKEESCIYRNGSSFKLKSGLSVTKWSDPLPEGREARTSFIYMIFASCPSNLSHGMTTLKTRIMSISYADRPAPKPGLF